MGDKPVYEIPVISPGETVEGFWAPQRLAPASRRAARLADAASAGHDGASPDSAGQDPAGDDPAFHEPAVPEPARSPAAPLPSDYPEDHSAASPQAFKDDGGGSGPGADPELINALHEVVSQGASDLHLTVNAPPMLRVDGGLRPAGDTAPWNREKVTSALFSLLTREQRAKFEEALELDFAYTVSANVRFRVNYYQQRDSPGGAFRLIPTEIKQFADLGIPASIGEFAKLPRGLVLVTGPTGSGKSTTLAAMIDLVNRTRADHIVTVEDPIEFLHQHKKSLINQREVGNDTHSFAAALKHVLRQDPDVILIGELRDLETISVALTAAETGHLVFATLHTKDAAQTIDRVIDVFPPHQQEQVRAQLAGTLQGVVCQALVKRAGGKGRVVATEVLVATPAIANLIREGKTYQIRSMMQAGRRMGMHTMDQHLADLVNAGEIPREAALEKVHDPETFDRLAPPTGPTAGSAGSAAAGAAGKGSGIDFGDSFSTGAR